MVPISNIICMTRALMRLSSWAQHIYWNITIQTTQLLLSIMWSYTRTPITKSHSSKYSLCQLVKAFVLVVKRGIQVINYTVKIWRARISIITVALIATCIQKVVLQPWKALWTLKSLVTWNRETKTIYLCWAKSIYDSRRC